MVPITAGMIALAYNIPGITSEIERLAATDLNLVIRLGVARAGCFATPFCHRNATNMSPNVTNAPLRNVP